MEIRKLIWTKAVSVFCALFIVSACDDNDSVSPGSGEVEFVITDAPVDDAEIKSVFVTVADVRVNGKSISNFSGKQTIDLKAYSKGKTYLLGSEELETRTYQNITLVLDHESDASGNNPGCYVLTQDGAKYALGSSGKTEINLSDSWHVDNKAKNTIVLDFDLRKSLRYDSDPGIRYKFAGNTELQTAVRVVEKNRSGMIQGTCDEEFDSNSEMIVAYAYKKGTFDAETETQANEEGILFYNAANSAKVESSLSGKTYTIAFLENGEYELYFVSYTEDSSGKYSFQSVLKAETTVNGSVQDFIKVDAGAMVTVSAFIKGIL